MKLLYIGTHFCPADALSRMFLFGDEVCFLDRPSVVFGNWGTVGAESFMRRAAWPTSPIKVTVLKPPSGPAQKLYQPFVEADIRNRDFVKTALDGLRKDTDFAERVLPSVADYGNGNNGAALRQKLLADPTLYDATYDLEDGNPELMYRPDLPEGRRLIVQTTLVDLSIQITSAQIMADEIEALPVADDSVLPRLLALRAGNTNYVGGTPRLSPYLGMQFARSVVPEAVLEKIDFKGIFEYRTETKDLYKAWNAEIAQAAAKITQTDMAQSSDAIQKIITTELMPKLREYENEMSSARDKMFGDIIKSVTAWELPTLSLSYCADFGYGTALAAFVAGARATIPHVVDYVNARRTNNRKHAVSFLVGLTKR
jgi:hypothetical protein